MSEPIVESSRLVGRRGFLRRLAGGCAAGIGLALLRGCGRGGGEAVVYTALDEVFSRGIFEDYRRRSGVRVLGVFDTEANKSVGLAARIPTVAAVEGNARQYCPAANEGWKDLFPETFRVSRGTIGTGVLTGPGLGCVPPGREREILAGGI